MIKKIKKNIDLYLLFTIGCTATMPIVSLNIFDKSLSFFNITIFIYILYGLLEVVGNISVDFVKQIYTKLDKLSKLMLLWLVLILISGLFGIYYFIGMLEWQKMIFSYFPKVIIYIVFFLLLVIKDKSNVNYLIKGIFFGAVFNLIWSCLDAMFYYSFGFSLTNKIFIRYIEINNIRYNQISLIIGNSIRSGGLNFDPAHIGMLAPIVFIYGILNHKFLYVILSILSIFSSMSTTAAVCILFLFLINIKNIKFNVKEFYFKKYHYKKSWKTKFLVLCVLVLFLTQFNSITSFVQKGSQSFIDRVSDTYVSNKLEDNIRVQYVMNLPYAISELGLKIITGTGLGTASYGYYSSEVVLNNMTFLKHEEPRPYDMENTYILYLLDIGVFGLVLYIYLLILLYKKYMYKLNLKENIAVYAGVSVIIVSNLFYHYTLFSVQILIMISGILLENGGEKNDCFNNSDTF